MEDKNLIKIILIYKGTSVCVETNPHKAIEQFLNEIIQFADGCSEDLLNMPVYDNGGNPMYYFVARKRKAKDGTIEILPPQNKEGIEMTLFDYEVEEGDELMIMFKPIS